MVFIKYFAGDDVEKCVWNQDPFHAQNPREFTSQEEESLIKVSCDSSFKRTCSDLVDFQVLVQNEYPVLSSKALIILMPFATSYLRDAGFSAVTVNTSKYPSKIDVEQEIRVAVSSLTPRFEKM